MVWRARTRGEAGSGETLWCSWTALPRVIHLVVIDNDVGDVNCDDHVGEEDDTGKANLQALAG